ncbi:MAG: SusC/RagA family TonB-linked outer membrane protein [Prevotellaceae bacterium]|jgi:TonB-linked SusC/RagA family outer membrane protein|nr:SusC/RagA family TonB-linked outer membrane protein [Prevotellaceae bacterium]
MMKNLILSSEILKRGVIMLLLFVGFSALSFAQTKTVTGTVVDENGEAQVAVSVFVQGTRIGAYTDAKGNYTIKDVPDNAVLTVSSIGYVTQTITVGDRSIVNVTLAEEATQLEEAVVTAEFGLKRVARSIGSSVQNVRAEEITESGRDNFITALQGRVSGITVTSTSGAPGASTSVVLRNYTSLSGSNQPLYVIDGVPMNNSTFDPSGFADKRDVAISTRDLDFASQGNDFNPEDIESMTILKGAAAAVLYGSDASNGAIIITTKKGTKDRGRVVYGTSLSLANAYGYPENQTKYANGAYGTTNFYYKNHFGSRYPEGSKFYDNYDAVLQTGVTQKHSLSIDGGTDKFTVRASTAYTDQTGVVKTTDYTRFNVSLSGKAEIKPWLEIEGAMNYATTTNTKAPKGSSGVFGQALRWPIFDDMRNYLAADGKHMKVNAPPYLDQDLTNPLFGLYKNKFYDESDNIVSSFTVRLMPVDNWYIITTAGWNISANTYETAYHPYYANYSNRSDGGYYNISKGNSNYSSLTFITGYTYDKLKNLTIQAQFGYNQLDQLNRRLSTYGDHFVDPNFISLNNCDPLSIVGSTSNTRRRVQSLFGTLEFNYKDMLFLNLRGRNDWSSTLPIDNNSYFYPAVEFSWIATELPLLKNHPVLSYLKIRGAVSQVGKDAPVLSVYPALEQTGDWGGSYRFGYTGPNPYLKPEMQTTYEGGFEARLWGNRVNADFTYYTTRCADQIVTGFRLSYATGYVLHNRNMGTFDAWGWESHIDVDVLKNKDFTWNVGINASKGKTKVIELPQNVSEFYSSSTWVIGNIRNGTSVGNPITSISALAKRRTDDGQLILSASTGLPVVETDNWSIIGDREPKIKFGISTFLKYKQFQLSALFDGRLGSTIVNGTKWLMWQYGLSEESVKYRESGSIYFNGVLQDGFEYTDNPTKSTIVFPIGLGGTTASIIYEGSNEDWIEKNVNYVRLQELRLTYKVPRKWLQKVTKGTMSDASVFVAGNDLLTITNYSGFDVVGNANSAALGGTGGVGFDVYSMPNPRSITFGFTLTF